MIKQKNVRKKRSPIWHIPLEELKSIVNISDSLSKILNHCGLKSKGGNIKTLKCRLIADDIDFSHIKLGNNSNKGRNFLNLYKLTLVECKQCLFIENCQYSRNTLRTYLKFYNLLPYICGICNNEAIWNGEILSLQIDHINGIGDDNRLENLRWLCPNCHSQTDTFAGKSNIKKYYCECGNAICKRARFCTECSNINKRKVPRPSKETLQEEMKMISLVDLGKKYGVSDNAIKKWAISFGI
jgi:hypothetical protein